MHVYILLSVDEICDGKSVRVLRVILQSAIMVKYSQKLYYLNNIILYWQIEMISGSSVSSPGSYFLMSEFYSFPI